MNTFTAPEVFGAGIGAAALLFSWTRADAEETARLAGGMGVSAIVGANPLLAAVTVAALACAYQRAKHERDAGAAADGLFRGAATAGATMGAVAAVAALGGGPGTALVIGLIVGLMVARAAGTVSVTTVATHLAVLAARAARSVLASAAAVGGRVSAAVAAVAPRRRARSRLRARRVPERGGVLLVSPFHLRVVDGVQLLLARGSLDRRRGRGRAQDDQGGGR